MHEIVSSEGNRRTVRFTESAERVTELFRKVRRQISRDMEMPGFRPGRIPRSIIDRRYGNLIKAEVADTVRETLTSKLLDEEDWILRSSSGDDEELPADGSSYSFEITFELFETPEPTGTDGITIEVPPLNVDEAVDRTIESFREKMVSFETADRPSRSGDLVVLETWPAGSGEQPHPMSLRIGDSGMGEGFDGFIEGVTAGHEFSARLQSDAPEPSANPVHCFRVIEVKNPVLPELDDGFAEKAAGVADMKELRKEVEESVRKRYDQEVDHLKERTVIESLLKSNPFDPPDYMVNNLTRDYVSRLGDDEPDENTLAAARDIARDKVREFLILRALAEKEGIEISPADLEGERDPEEAEPSAVDRLRNRRALELILERADIRERRKSDDEGAGEDAEQTRASAWRWVSVDPVTEECPGEPAGEEGS